MVLGILIINGSLGLMEVGTDVAQARARIQTIAAKALMDERIDPGAIFELTVIQGLKTIDITKDIESYARRLKDVQEVVLNHGKLVDPNGDAVKRDRDYNGKGEEEWGEIIPIPPNNPGRDS